ncbi:MAG: glycosyl hydrolase [Bacteroidia bacterium]
MRLYLLTTFLIPVLLCFSQSSNTSAGGQLKIVVYDFDGLDIGSTDLPDGDYKNNDLAYTVSTNPLGYSDVLSDRVLKIDMNWQAGLGVFGKVMRFFELNVASDYANFYIYNPTSNSGPQSMQLLIAEDDNGNNVYESTADDKWMANITVPQSGGWQLISVPLSSLQDVNPGGNGVFDASYSGGQIFSFELLFTKPNSSSTYDQYYIDMLSFSEGALPHGASILDLPQKNSGSTCLLGALAGDPSPDQVPGDIEGMLPPGKHLTFVNWFVYYSNSGTVANEIPGPEVQNLINNGYTPVITWEMMYGGYSRLDPVQPRLDKILNGYFDGYIDAFANKIKSYSGDVIMRIFHEFEGDWYSWSLTQNNASASTYIAAYKHVVDRFNNLGVTNVKWMWCVNAEPKPYTSYNWIMSCYPGDNYVDIVATDIYNHPNLGTPAWKSFRYTMAETYCYLNKFVPNKPLYICEVASRERDGSEPAGSQSKADWICQMNRDLQSYFPNTRAVIFFSLIKEHDWRINSSSAALQAFVNCIWNDPFYNGPVSIAEFENFSEMKVYPNPFKDDIKLQVDNNSDTTKNIDVKIFDATGKLMFVSHLNDLSEGVKTGGILAPGLYFLELQNNSFTRKCKMIKAGG